MSDNTLSILADLGLAAARERESAQAAQPARVEPRRVLAVGEVEVHDGLTVWDRDSAEAVVGPDGPITRVRRERVVDEFDPHDYAATQPAAIRVLHRHDRDRPVGRVIHLEWRAGEPARILACFEVDAAEAEFWAGRDAYISPGTQRVDGRLRLDHLGLVDSTARIAAAPVKWAATTFAERSLWTPQSTPGYRVLVRAAAAHRKRAKDAGIRIMGHPGDEQLEERYVRPKKHPEHLLLPEYMRNNGEGGLHYSGGIGQILKVQ